MRQKGRIRVGSPITTEPLVAINRVMSAREVFIMAIIGLGEFEGMVQWTSKIAIKWQLERGHCRHTSSGFIPS